MSYPEVGIVSRQHCCSGDLIDAARVPAFHACIEDIIAVGVVETQRGGSLAKFEQPRFQPPCNSRLGSVIAVCTDAERTG